MSRSTIQVVGVVALRRVCTVGNSKEEIQTIELNPLAIRLLFKASTVFSISPEGNFPDALMNNGFRELNSTILELKDFHLCLKQELIVPFLES